MTGWPIRAVHLANLLICATALSAQTPRPSFEVASIRPAEVQGQAPGIGAGSRGGAGASSSEIYRNSRTTVFTLIAWAYDVRVYNAESSFYLVGGPDWIRRDRFAIEAKAPEQATTPQMRLMMQSLLADRFKLVMHKETRETRLYSLVRARTDGSLGKNIAPCDRSQTSPPWNRMSLPSDALPFVGWCEPIVDVAYFASRELKMPVVDRTDLTGSWTWQFAYSPQRPGADVTQTPPLTTAVQEELGLKLEAGRGPVDVFVIDSVERPTPN
jgi:uncharacterized protein (TIGR03435 family)